MCCRNEQVFIINKQPLLYFFLRLRRCCFSVFFYREIFSLPLSFSLLEAISSVFSLLSFSGWCVCVEVRLFVPCRCCLCCVELVTRFPFVPKQAATVKSADPRPWKMASIIWGPVCSWQFSKLDSSGHWDKSLWGTKDVLLLFHYSSSYSEVWAHRSLVWKFTQCFRFK